MDHHLALSHALRVRHKTRPTARRSRPRATAWCIGWCSTGWIPGPSIMAGPRERRATGRRSTPTTSSSRPHRPRRRKRRRESARCRSPFATRMRTAIDDWPITTGVPFPQGELGSADHVRLHGRRRRSARPDPACRPMARRERQMAPGHVPGERGGRRPNGPIDWSSAAKYAGRPRPTGSPSTKAPRAWRSTPARSDSGSTRTATWPTSARGDQPARRRRRLRAIRWPSTPTARPTARRPARRRSRSRKRGRCEPW